LFNFPVWARLNIIDHEHMKLVLVVRVSKDLLTHHWFINVFGCIRGRGPWIR